MLHVEGCHPVILGPGHWLTLDTSLSHTTAMIIFNNDQALKTKTKLNIC